MAFLMLRISVLLYTLYFSTYFGHILNIVPLRISVATKKTHEIRLSDRPFSPSIKVTPQNHINDLFPWLVTCIGESPINVRLFFLLLFYLASGLCESLNSTLSFTCDYPVKRVSDSFHSVVRLWVLGTDVCTIVSKISVFWCAARPQALCRHTSGAAYSVLLCEAYRRVVQLLFLRYIAESCPGYRGVVWRLILRVVTSPTAKQQKSWERMKRMNKRKEIKGSNVYSSPHMEDSLPCAFTSLVTHRNP